MLRRTFFHVDLPLVGMDICYCRLTSHLEIQPMSQLNFSMGGGVQMSIYTYVLVMFACPQASKFISRNIII